MSLTPVANGKIFKFTLRFKPSKIVPVIYHGGKFTAGVVDLPISPQILDKFELNQTFFSWSWRKMIHEKI
jgi:hypothetical protein